MLNKVVKLYKKPWLIIVDILLLNLALLASFYVRFDNDVFSNFKFLYILVISMTGLIVLFFSNLYNKMWKYASVGELLSIVKTTGLINLVFILFVYFSRTSFSRGIILINFILDIFLLGGLRFTLRIIKDYLNNADMGHLHTRVLVIGAGDAADIIIREMKKHRELGKSIVGLIDDDPAKSNLEIHGKKVLGTREDIPEIIKKYSVDEVLIAIPSAEGKDVKDIYELSKQDGVRVNIVPGMYEIINGDVNLSQIREVKVEDLLRRDPVKLDTSNIASYIEDQTVLVTGGAGSIGSELCRQIVRFNPERLLILDINENNTYFLELELKKRYSNVEIIPVIASIRDKDKLEQVFELYRPDVVFHAAAHKHVPLMEHNPEEAIKNNIFGTRNVAYTADEYGVKRFVLISTDKAVNPTNVMGASKRVAEMIIQTLNEKSKTKFMAVRFGNVLGSEGSVIPIFKNQIAQGGPVTVTHDEITRYFMTIPEASQLVMEAGSLGKGGEVFVLDMGEPVRIIDLAKDLIKLSGLKLNKDIEIAVTGLRPGEKLYEELLANNENISTDHERVFIARLENVELNTLNNSLNKLNQLVDDNNTSGIIKALVELVGTYVPNRDNVIDIQQKKSLGLIKKQKDEIAVNRESN